MVKYSSGGTLIEYCIAVPSGENSLMVRLKELKKIVILQFILIYLTSNFFVSHCNCIIWNDNCFLFS